MPDENKLFNENIGLVKKIAHRMDYGYCEVEDLIQVGLMGLLLATKKYDESFNVPFSSFASIYIISNMKEEMRTNKSIIVQKPILKLIKRLKDIKEKKSIEELSILFNASREEVLLALIYQEKIVSLNSIHDEHELIEEINIDDKSLIKDALNLIDEMSQEIMILRYFKGYTQKEVAKIINTTQSKVSRLEKLALKKLKMQIT